ncbi:DUF4157 domain-containing protein [Fulvivirga ulvae]|uniref:eCIS core domain-containing protein n=1 Tax=Fulvivirga ulvae TaxID=2904245 RepID=UPI001F36A682|nr:DUF4157 domain-containing protein [Fulvivirga ulvae]UII31360.1 DUF4157 domain-containing protein [Fulvivirga ulvae]
MKTHIERTQGQNHSVISNSVKPPDSAVKMMITDNRPSTIYQRKLRETMNSSAINETPIQQRANSTGLPNNLKAGIENLSGYSMDDVKVHYNSGKPAQLQAHAYAQGTDIHLAPGQEKHLPHEAWHVVQQKQGRVKPTVQLKGKMNINDDLGLEREADVMGSRALSGGNRPRIQEVQGTDLSPQLPLRDTGINGDNAIVQGKFNRELDINPSYRTQFFQQLCNKAPNTGDQTYTDMLLDAMLLTRADLYQMFIEALEYINSTATGRSLLETIGNWRHTVTIRVGYNESTKAMLQDRDDRATDPNIKINWNPLMSFAVWNDDHSYLNQAPAMGSSVGIMSPAAVLLHEMGHVCQYIHDTEAYDVITNAEDDGANLYGASNFEVQGRGDTTRLLEHHNMTNYEHPFAAEKSEPIRNKYGNTYVEGDKEHNPNANIPQNIRPLLDAAMAERRQFIAQNGWVASVTQHTNNPQAAGRFDTNLRPLMYIPGPYGLTDTMNNPLTLYSSAWEYCNNLNREIEGFKRSGNWNTFNVDHMRVVVKYLLEVITSLRIEERREILLNLLGHINTLRTWITDNNKLELLKTISNKVYRVFVRRVRR